MHPKQLERLHNIDLPCQITTSLGFKMLMRSERDRRYVIAKLANQPTGGHILFYSPGSEDGTEKVRAR